MRSAPSGSPSRPDAPRRRIRPSFDGLWRKAAAPFAVLLASIPLAGCNPSVLHPKGPVGIGDGAILVGSVIIMLAIVVPTVLATLAFAWWFRSSNARARYMPDWEYSGQLELIVWAIPLLTIMLLGGVAWIGSHDLDPAKPLASESPPLEVGVVSLDWKWLFIYPDQGVASVNRLVIPAGVPVHFSLTSASVMNAFFIPELGSMIYTMNGMRTQLYLMADQLGTFYGRSTHFSGDGFAGMQFEVESASAHDFAAWIDKARSAGPTLTPQTYAELAKQSINVAPFTYRDVEPDLFRKIVQQVIPPGPGPAPTPTPEKVGSLCVGPARSLAPAPAPAPVKIGGL